MSVFRLVLVVSTTEKWIQLEDILIIRHNLLQQIPYKFCEMQGSSFDTQHQISQEGEARMVRISTFVNLAPMRYVHFVIPFLFSQVLSISNQITATSCLCWIAHNSHCSIFCQNSLVCSLSWVAVSSDEVNLNIIAKEVSEGMISAKYCHP